MRINLGLSWKGPDIEGHGKSLSNISGEKSYWWVLGGGLWGGVVAYWIIVSAPVPVPFLWTLDLGFVTMIWDLGFGLGFGTELGLDNIGDQAPNFPIKNIFHVYAQIQSYNL